MLLEERDSGSAAQRSPSEAKANRVASEGSFEQETGSSKALCETFAFEIDDLVAGITTSNRHNEISFGRPLGRELL